MIIKENYTKIDNFLLDEVMNKIKDSEFKVLMSINRFLIGFQKKQDHISIEKIVKHTGLTWNTVSKALKNLEAYKIIKVSSKIIKGFVNTIIEINLNTNDYSLPKKEKLKEKVSNFLKTEKTKTIENIKVEPIIISTPLQILKTASNLEDTPLQILKTPPSNLEDIKENILNKNIKTYHEEKNNDNVLKIDNDFLEVKTILENHNFYNPSDFIKTHGIEKIKNALNYIEISIEEGVNISNVGAYLRANINKITEEKKETLTPGPQNKNEIEEKIKAFFFQKGKLFNTTYSEALNICLEKLFLNRDTFLFMNEFKALNVPKNALKEIYLKVCKDDILFKNKFSEKILEETLFNLDNIESIKIKEKALEEKKLLSIQEMQKTINEKNKRLLELKALANKENNTSYNFIKNTVNAVKNITNEIKETVKETTKKLDIFGNDLNETIPI